MLGERLRRLYEVVTYHCFQKCQFLKTCICLPQKVGLAVVLLIGVSKTASKCRSL